MYGLHSLIYLGGCNHRILDLEAVRLIMVEVCDILLMRRYGPCHIHRFGVGNEIGLSAFQLIYSSNVSLHTNDGTREGYLDVFSCMPYDLEPVLTFLKNELEPEILNVKPIYRR